MQRHSYHRSPRGPSFCSCKRKQNRAKGNQAFPFANPFDAKLRLDTNDALASSVQRRRYALKVPAAHLMWGNCKPIAGSHDAKPMGWISSCLDRRPLPRCGGGGRGRGQIRRGYLWSASVRSTDLFFPIIEGKTIFVSSTAKRQRGLSRGNSSPLTRFCLLLAVQKEAPAG